MALASQRLLNPAVLQTWDRATSRKPFAGEGIHSAGWEGAGCNLTGQMASKKLLSGALLTAGPAHAPLFLDHFNRRLISKLQGEGPELPLVIRSAANLRLA